MTLGQEKKKMTEQDNFENLFESALLELNKSTAEQPTNETEQVETNEPTDVAEATEVNNGETEVGEVDDETSVDNEGNTDTKPIAVTDNDTIVLPDGTTVSVKEAVLRQADYTRKTQALAEERKQIEADRSAAQSAVEYVENLTKAWQSNQAEVVSGFISSTDDPTLILSQVIVELAKAEKLDPKFLETFGITPETQEKWSSEAKSQNELQSVKARLERFENEKAQELKSQKEKQQEEQLVQEYENQWKQIVVDNNIKLEPQQELDLKVELLQYALNYGIPNLNAAWKALQFEKSNAKPVANKNKAAVDAKKLATNAITSKSAGKSVVTNKPVQNIEDAVWQTFNELTNKSN